MARAITALNSAISTVSVSVNVLMIERKQVTLAVFRQIIEEEIFDWSAMALRGVAWGYVRYLIDVGHEEAINLVWQRRNELRRCIVRRRVHDIYKQEFREALEHPIIAGNPHYSLEAIEVRPWEEARVFPRRICVPWGQMRVSQQPLLKVPELSPGDHNSMRKELISAYTEKVLGEATLLCNALAEQYEAYEKMVEPLFDLPQLFIAV